ncbi:MAG: Gx transporter family protein [Ruminococcaceae bacterium]|nr:Gx transporter family protein [Oscillospiraceae bacterium]
MGKTKKLTLLGLLAALSIILSFVESLLPPIYAAVPGIKIGLANIVSVLLLYKFSLKDTAIVTLVRVLTVAFLFGNVMTLSYSLAGAFLSITVMALLKKTKLFSTIGVSISGGVAHNLGQIIVAILVTSTLEIGYYMIFLCISGVLSGTLIGILGALVLKYTKNLKG